MITLHRAESTVFTSLGLGVISDMVGGVVVEELNGIFELTMKYPTTGIRYKDFQLRRIIYAKPNPYSDPQPFRIYSISKPINRVVTINACHISYDLTGYPVNEFKGTSPSDTMSKLKSNAQVPHNFTFNTTVTTTGEVNIDGPRTTRSVLGNNILSAYGGEYEFDNFMVYHYASRGMNRGVSVRYGKNMTDLNQEENISNVYTGVYPYWEGTDVNTNNKILFKLPERVINTPGTYSFTRILPLDLSQEFTEKPTEEKLREKANKYITDNKIGIPTVALTMTFIQLSKSTENSNFKVLDQVELGDTISVYFEELGVDATARCIKTTYNLCADRYDSIDLGDAKSNLSVGISDSKKETAKALEKQKVFFDAEVGNIKIDIAHIDQAIIDKADINWVSANYAHLVNGYIDIAQIKDASIGTAQIKDAEITVAKIQNAFVDSLVAAQGKFKSAHIGVLTSDNIDANTITADYIKAVVIDAINLNVSGKISANRIDTTNLVVENIDAGKITTGTLSASRIGANSIDASKIKIVDFTNYATLYQNYGDPNFAYNLTGSDHALAPGYIPVSDWGTKEEFVFDLECQTFDVTTVIHLAAGIYVKYSDSTTSYFTVKIEDAANARNWVKRTTTVVATPTVGKIPVSFLPVLQIPESPTDSSTNNWKVRQVVVRRKNAGKLIVDGSIQANHLSVGSVTADKIDANAITAELLKVNVIQAINLTTFKIDAKNINTDNLVVNGSLIAGDINAENIKTQVIAAINSYTGTARIKQAQIETLKVGNANIIDLDASKINAGKLSAQYIDVTNLQIASGNVTGTFTANKISGGTFDASTMTVVNLKADSITAGSLTIDGDNLLRNSGWLTNTYFWNLDTGWLRTESKYNNCNICQISRTGLTSDDRKDLNSSSVLCDVPGSKYVASVYAMTPDRTLIDGGNCLIEIAFYNSSNNYVGSISKSIKPSTNNVWERFIINATVPANASSFRYRIDFFRNGTLNVALPMIQRGSIASEFKMHVDEQISSGAITNDKIGNEAITSGKLNIQELFVGSNAFINQLKAFEINAAQITTGKISGERIELSGLISFESLDTNLQPIFDTTGNKVYINGGMIAANSITAQSIDLKSGLTVTGPDETITFSIASNGMVTANALLQSGNFDEIKQTGYQLSPDGTAILNQALVRGDVVLPNAGMTNFGGQIGNDNLLLNSDLSNNTAWFLPTNVEYIIGGGYNGDNAILISRYNWVTGQPRLQVSQSVSLTDFLISDNITFSCWVFIDEDSVVLDSETSVSIRFKRMDGTTIDSRLVSLNTVERGRWVYVSGTTSIPANFDSTQSHSLLISLSQNGTIKISRVKLEGGEVATPWCPAKSEQFNYTRMWAGSSFDARNSAPFRVMQNGDVYAKNAILEGILYGRVDSGYVNIDQNQLSIVDDTNLPNKEYVRMNDLIALFDIDVLFGNESDRMIDINRTSRSLTTTDTEVMFTGSQTNVGFSSVAGTYGGLSLIGVVSEGKHTIRHSSVASRLGTLVFDSQGARSEESDFSFTRNNYTEDVNVLIDGFLKVKKDIKSTVHNIEMRSVPNEGWGFYAG